MKTKHILTAMVLPAMLAACTADEIVENNNVANVQGRALLNPMAITVNGGADSRAIWSEEGYGKFVWDSEKDKFSAFLLDVDATDTDKDGVKEFTGPVNSDQLMTNYIYSSEDGEKYTTTSQMVEGAYWFYAPGREKNTRDLIPFKMEVAQDYDYYTQSTDVQAFFTPIYNLTSVDSPSSLDLSLTPYFGRAVVTITNTTEEDFTLNQVVLESTNNPFVYEGNISVQALKTAGLVKTYVADCDEWHYVGASITSTMTDAQKAEKYAAKDEAMEVTKTTANLVAVDDSKKETKMIVLNLEGEEGYLAVGQTKEFNLVVPRTEAATNCKITLIANKGVKTIESDIQTNYKNGIQFKHNGIMPMFGKTTDGFKAYDVKKFDNLGTNVYYVTSYGQMMNLINTVNGDFTVYNIGDWGIDAAMAKLIAEESDVHVYFKNHIYVTAEAQSRTAEDNTITLKKVTFLKGFTVKEETEVELAAASKNVLSTTASVHAEGINVEEGATLKITTGTIYGGMKIAEGATVNLAGGTINGIIVNEGILNVTAAIVETKIENYGTLTLTDNAPVVDVKEGAVTYATAKTTGWTTLTNANLTLPADSKVNATITINSNVKMTFTKSMIVDQFVDGTTIYAVKLVNNGEIALGQYNLTIDGELENAENAEISGTGTLTINGSAENDGVVKTQYSKISTDATLENNGTWYADKNAVNDGTVTLGENSKTRFNYGSGIINNNALSKNLILEKNSDAAKKMTVYYTFTSAVNSADVNALDCEEYSLNKIIFNEKLTIDVDADNAVTSGGLVSNGITKLNEVKTLEFLKGLVIEADVKNQTIDNGLTEIIISGSDVTFEGSNWLGAEGETVCAIGLIAPTTNITVKTNCKLTVEDMTLCPVGTAAKLTFTSLIGTASGDEYGAVENNGTIYTGKEGVAYGSESWWTGAAAVKGYYNSGVITTIQ